MKIFIVFLGLFTTLLLNAQDKVFMNDRTVKTGKVLEIGPEIISLHVNYEVIDLYRYDVVAIEFENGTVEVLNSPVNDLIYTTGSGKSNEDAREKSLYKPHFVSVNTLSLYNADVAGFYEYIPKNKLMGIGIMGAYNFNPYSTLSNAFITVLNNPKKNYDLGAFINFYPEKFDSRTTFYGGILVKYMNFSYDGTKVDSVITNTSRSAAISYIPSQGSQLATIITTGSHTIFNNHFYVRTIAGLGAFKLRGRYKEEYNKIVNQGSKDPQESNYLPKFYFGINVGFNL